MKNRQRSLLLGVGVLLAALIVVAAMGDDLQAGLRPTPTAAALVERGTPSEPVVEKPHVVVKDDEFPPALRGRGGPRVRLKQDVLVHTAPSADAPRPLVSLLGAGQVADLIESQDEWILIEFGPLRGWTRRSNVEEVRAP